MRLKDRRILITGAASGIGAATARRFAGAGARVGLLDRDRDGLQAVRRDIGDTCAIAVADVSRVTEVAAAVAQVARGIGGLDGVVNCAGIDLLRPFADMAPAEWQRILDVNLNGPMHVCHAVLPLLRQAGGGTIVNVSSGAGLRPLEHRTAYCSSKAALVMFSKALAIDLAADNVRVNAICPGIIETPLFRTSYETMPDPDAELARILDRYVIKRVGRPEEIAAAALFLTSAESAYVTGAALAVDGGRTFH